MRRDGQKAKLLYLLQLLKQETDAEHGLTMAQIVNRLADRGIHAERKSLYDDFDELRRFGVQLIGPTGRERTYAIVGRTFEPAELRMLVDVIQSAKFLSEEETQRLIGKIARLTSIHETRKLHRSVVVANRVKSMNGHIWQIIDLVQSAIMDNRRITFRYFNYTPHRTREYHRDGQPITVSPWTLVYQEDKYFLIADENGMTKHFRVDRMDDVEVTDLPRTEETDFDAARIADYTKAAFRMFSGPVERVTMILENRFMGTVLDHFGSDVFVNPVGREHFRITVPVAISPQFFGWVLGLGTGIRLEEPSAVITQFRQYLQDVQQMYGAGDINA